MSPSRRDRRRLPAVALAAACALASLTACGGKSDSGSQRASSADDGIAGDSSEAPDPCTLLPQKALDKALGHPATKTKGPVDQARGRTCSWTFDTGTAAAGHLTISAWHGRVYYAPEPLGLQPIPGIADEAAGEPEKGIVMMRKGDTVVQIFLVGLTDKASDAVRALARAAAAGS